MKSDSDLHLSRPKFYDLLNRAIGSHGSSKLETKESRKNGDYTGKKTRRDKPEGTSVKQNGKSR